MITIEFLIAEYEIKKEFTKRTEELLKALDYNIVKVPEALVTLATDLGAYANHEDPEEEDFLIEANRRLKEVLEKEHLVNLFPRLLTEHDIVNSYFLGCAYSFMGYARAESL